MVRFRFRVPIPIVTWLNKLIQRSLVLEPEGISAVRRRMLMWMLPLFSVAGIGGVWSTSGLDGQFAMSSVTVGLFILTCTICWLLLRGRRLPAEVVAVIVFASLDVLMINRLVHLISEVALRPDLPAFLPMYAYLPIFIIAAFLLMPASWAFVNALLLSCAALLTAVPTVLVGLDAEPARFGNRQLLLYVGLALPILTATMWGLSQMEWSRRDAVRTRELQRRLDQALTASRDGLWERNDAGSDAMWWSASMFELLGIAPNSIHPTVSLLRSHCAPEDLEAFDSVLGSQHPGESITEARVRLNLEDGSRRWFSLRGAGVPGATVGASAAGSLRDIDSQQRAEAQLREASERLIVSEQRFRESFDRAAIGMALVSLEGRWIQVNNALCEMIGYTEAELKAATFQDITHPDDLETDLHLVRQLLDGKIESYRMDKRYLDRDGSEVPIRLYVSLVRDSDGRPVHFISQIQNISGEVERERRLQELVAELKRSNQDLEEFAYTASHDLKAPLRTIKSFSQLLERKLGSAIEAEDLELLQMVIDSADDMSRLVEELLRFAKLDRGTMSIEPVPVAEVATELAAQLVTADGEATVCIDVAEDLPTLNCDRIRLRQILQNLISNGLKYNEQDQRRVHVHADGETVLVDDNGIGIAEEQRERVFTIFRRLHGPEAYGGGSGAGLTIVKKLVELHGGTIRIDDSPLGGTRFAFTLQAEAGKHFDHGIRVTGERLPAFARADLVGA